MLWKWDGIRTGESQEQRRTCRRRCGQIREFAEDHVLSQGPCSLTGTSFTEWLRAGTWRHSQASPLPPHLMKLVLLHFLQTWVLLQHGGGTPLLDPCLGLCSPAASRHLPVCRCSAVSVRSHGLSAGQLQEPFPTISTITVQNLYLLSPSLALLGLMSAPQNRPWLPPRPQDGMATPCSSLFSITHVLPPGQLPPGAPFPVAPGSLRQTQTLWACIPQDRCPLSAPH